MKNLRSLFGILTAIIMITACTSATDGGAPPAEQGFTQQVGDLLHGEVMAVAYSGFREGQHPDRGDGAANPSADEILEDLPQPGAIHEERRDVVVEPPRDADPGRCPALAGHGVRRTHR